MIDGSPHFLWVQTTTSRIQPFKDMVDTRIVFWWRVLSHDSCVNDRVIEINSVFFCQCVVGRAQEICLFNICQLKYPFGRIARFGIEETVIKEQQ